MIQDQQVCDVVPSSRWPIMESSGDGRPSAFDRSFGIFLIVFVIKIFHICFLHSGSHVGRVIGPEQDMEFEQVDQRWKSWSLMTCSAPPNWWLRCNLLTAIDSDDVAMGVGASYNLCLDGWWYSLGRGIQIGCSPCSLCQRLGLTRSVRNKPWARSASIERRRHESPLEVKDERSKFHLPLCRPRVSIQRNHYQKWIKHRFFLLIKMGDLL